MALHTVVNPFWGYCRFRYSLNFYCRPYEPQAKGKLERWHCAIRDQFISELNLSIIRGLDELNIRILAWLEQLHHQSKHSSLDQTPLQRY